ncbi:hypothetical protein AC1031_001424 [Aphanomyces cochlioides]|nr:hypothetical protein AC1031_001424 [Aphanomyces cochlioides]
MNFKFARQKQELTTTMNQKTIEELKRELEERKVQLDEQRSTRLSLQHDLEILQRKHQDIALVKSKKATEYYTAHTQLLRAQKERDEVSQKRKALERELYATAKQKAKWQQRLEHVTAVQTEERQQWSTFLASMEQTLLANTKHLALEHTLHHELRIVSNKLQPKYEHGIKKLQEAKQEIQETKMIILDMEKKKQILNGRIRQAQFTHDQLLARERNARATFEAYDARADEDSIQDGGKPSSMVTDDAQ